MRRAVAAAGTTALLVGTFGATATVAVAAPTSQQAAALAPAAAPTDQPGSSQANAIPADAIANGYIDSGTDMTNAKNTLSGRAFISDKGTPATFGNGLSAVPEGTEVYMQWIDKDGAVSPWYSAKTSNALSNSDANQAGPGAYAFDLREGWTDAKGKKHTYNATAGQYYKLVIPDSTNPATGNTITMMRQAGGFFPGSFVNSVTDSNLGQFPLTGTNMQRTAVFMTEQGGTYMHRPEAEWITDSEGPLPNPWTSLRAKNSVSGQVWLETGAGDRANSATGPNNNSKDPEAAGYTVVMSSLTSEGAQAYEAQVESLDESQRAAAAAELLKAHPEYISATVQGKTDENGKYTLRFPDGTLNDQYLYMQVFDPQGELVNGYSGYTSPEFRKPNANLSFTPQTAPAQNLVQRPMWYNVNYAIVARTQVDLQITNYDVSDNPARPGDTAELDFTGVMPPLASKIEWVDSNGEVVKTCDPVTSEAEAEACTFEVPADAPDGMVYTARLVSGDNIIAADSFIVDLTPITDNLTPAYEDTTVEEGKGGTVPTPTYTDADGNPATAPEGTKYEPNGDLPDGFTVNEDGSITIDPSVPAGDYTIPVLVTYPDGSTDTV
ncbi:YPDG domain-containing protein, partial [Helcobacillus massiliensis]